MLKQGIVGLKDMTESATCTALSKAGGNIGDFQTVLSLVPTVHFLPFRVRWVDRELYLICSPETCWKSW